MSKTQIPVYATPNDWFTLLSSVISSRPLRFANAGLFDTPTAEVFEDPSKLHSFASYLLLDRPAKVATRAVSQRNGSTKYAVDQIDNANSVVIHTGGMMDHARLVAGQVGTTRTEQASQDLYALIAKEIKRQFVKVKSYSVGPQAVELLDAKGRLTPTSKSPPEYDLIR